MKLRLKSGERLYINGAVLRFENKTSLEFLNDVYFLLERQIVQPEEVKTDKDRLYFLVQLMVIEPQQLEFHLAKFRKSIAEQQVSAEGDLRFDLYDIEGLVLARRYHEAMKRLRYLGPKKDSAEGTERKVA